jgi:hypothetical protein
VEASVSILLRSTTAEASLHLHVGGGFNGRLKELL